MFLFDVSNVNLPKFLNEAVVEPFASEAASNQTKQVSAQLRQSRFNS
jgi:hypothetical protein